MGSFRNLTFLPIIIANTLIGIIQEIRAKRTLEKMSILNAPHAIVVRDGSQKQVASEELVEDDVILLRAGDQICGDASVLFGEVMVNESLLTGESDEINKTQGDELLSGSFVVSGQCYARLTHVGMDSYISKLSLEAKSMERTEQSEMIRSINQLVKWVGIAIIPIGIVLFSQSYFFNGETIARSVTATVAAVIGMIPEGLYLLATIALALGTIRLATKKVLLHDMKSIETLSRVDVLCVDKTGTITEPGMQVSHILWRRQVMEENGAEDEKGLWDREALQGMLADYVYASTDNNATMDALRAALDKMPEAKAGRRRPSHIQAFSSANKYGSMTFSDGTYFLGAPEFIMKDSYDAIAEEIASYVQKGYRLLLFAKQEADGILPLGYVTLSNPIRANAKETFSYFKEQDVAIRVISGDNPQTVSEVARRAGIEGAENHVDATTLDSKAKIRDAVERYTVFGRVTPKQKQLIVKALQEAGHTVAMTGDGVNDVLALKEADCSIAMAQGSDAAKNIANVVLLDSNFASMPHIVNQGRRVVNNIRTAASMFLIKTMFSVMLSLLTIFFGNTYPFEPIQMSLISACAVGIPTFLLAQENNYDKIDHTFLRHVFLNAFPAAITISSCVFAIMLVCQNVYHSMAMLNTACVLVTGWNYMAALKTVYAPLNTYRKVIIYGMQFIFFAAAVIFQKLLSLGSLDFGMIILVFILMTFSPVVIEVITEWCRSLYDKAHEREKKGFIALFLEKVQK